MTQTWKRVEENSATSLDQNPHHTNVFGPYDRKTFQSKRVKSTVLFLFLFVNPPLSVASDSKENIPRWIFRSPDSSYPYLEDQKRTLSQYQVLGKHKQQWHMVRWNGLKGWTHGSLSKPLLSVSKVKFPKIKTEPTCEGLEIIPSALREFPSPLARTLAATEKNQLLCVKQTKESQDLVWLKVLHPQSSGVSWIIQPNTVAEKISLKNLVEGSELRGLQLLRGPLGPLFLAFHKDLVMSTDGNHWQTVISDIAPTTPLAISEKSGWIVVGEKLSQNWGKKFDSFVRWDQILNQVSQGSNVKAKEIRIQSAKIYDKNPNSPIVQLQLQLTSQFKGWVTTFDGGQSWRWSEVAKAPVPLNSAL